MARLFLQNFFEYLYDYITKKGRTFLFDRLDRDDFLKVKSEAKIKHFVEKSSLEEKLLLASKLGARVAIVVWDENDEKTKTVQDVLVDYLALPDHEIGRKIVKDKVFASMDIDFIKAVQLVSKSSNSKHYAVNRKYLQVKDNASFFNPRMLVDKLSAETNLEWYASTILHALQIEPTLENFKIDLDQFKLLLFLHNCPNGATKEALRSKVEKTGRITFLLNDMRAMSMIRYDVRNENIIFIHTYGIIVLDQIISKFP